MNLDDLLKIVPGLKRKRSINAEELRVLLDRKRKECTWCGNICSGRRTKWCSDCCVEKFRERCDSGYLRGKALERDKGICQMCGRDTFKSEMDAKHIKYEQFNDSLKFSEALAPFGYARGRWREVDHIVPVVEYGGLCGLDGVRTLCGGCHRQETAKLSRKSK